MLRSLTNKFIGILTVSEVHELIDIFKGKGRHDITPSLEKFLTEVREEEIPHKGDKKVRLLHRSLIDRDQGQIEGSLTEQDYRYDEKRKGVLFILDSFKRTKKYQEKLKSIEIINLYNKVSGDFVGNSNSVEKTTVTKSKGILVNKKHF